MDNHFSFEFNSYLKKCQPKPIKIYLQIIIGVILMVGTEIGFFKGYEKFVAVGCSLPNQKNSQMTIDNCFNNDLLVTKCINNWYNTGSNYSLSFNAVGKTDKYNSFIITILVISFIMFLCLFQTGQYFQSVKRKRIQNILAGSMILIDGEKKNEKKVNILLFIIATCFIFSKVMWLLNRFEVYGEIECSGNLYYLEFEKSLFSYISGIIMGSIGYIIMPIIFLIGWLNYLSELEFKKLTQNLSKISLEKLNEIYVFDNEKYNKLIKSTLKKRYPKDSKTKLYMKCNTFKFWKTTTSEIVEILLLHKESSIEEFVPIQTKDSKVSFSSDGGMNDKLIQNQYL
ncbi:hypothetical protein RB653_002896 [Dictyostelium firmibasis]|uniref:Uncharacterized protein n=1 Tax=Dictyostelium firmibasis TaxID=79012 RepID=A0AAN7TYD5_9MYCE